VKTTLRSSSQPSWRPARRVFARPQRGLAAVEFAMVASLLFTLLFGVIEMGRLLWTWNAAVEATRHGARLAAVCDQNASRIKAAMVERLPALSASQIVITYLNPPAADNTCTATDCKAVRVSLRDATHQTLIPLVPLNLALPAFATTQRKESMNSTANEVCQ
jgi:Flp pilus assembly protein TadG